MKRKFSWILTAFLVSLVTFSSFTAERSEAAEPNWAYEAFMSLAQTGSVMATKTPIMTYYSTSTNASSGAVYFNGTYQGIKYGPYWEKGVYIKDSNRF